MNAKETIRTFLSFASAVCGAGLLGGARFSSFVAAAVAVAATRWIAPRILAKKGREMFVTLDPQDPAEGVLADALRQALQKSRETKGDVLLRIQAQTEARYFHFSLNLSRTKDIELKREGKRGVPLLLAGQWIADHPLPLAIPNDRAMILRFAPASSTRVRVSVDTPPRSSPVFWLCVVSALIFCALLDATLPLALLAGVAFSLLFPFTGTP